MGASCVKTNNTAAIDLRDEKTKKEYYLNLKTNDQNEHGEGNYDIKEQKRVGYGHI